jgi:serine-threonine kinase receptor-associated protein
LIRKVSVPTVVYSASLLLSNKIFICGGEDFKLYKYNFETGTEIGKKDLN